METTTEVTKEIFTRVGDGHGDSVRYKTELININIMGQEVEVYIGKTVHRDWYGNRQNARKNERHDLVIGYNSGLSKAFFGATPDQHEWVEGVDEDGEPTKKYVTTKEFRSWNAQKNIIAKRIFAQIARTFELEVQTEGFKADSEMWYEFVNKAGKKGVEYDYYIEVVGSAEKAEQERLEREAARLVRDEERLAAAREVFATSPMLREISLKFDTESYSSAVDFYITKDGEVHIGTPSWSDRF